MAARGKAPPKAMRFESLYTFYHPISASFHPFLCVYYSITLFVYLSPSLYVFHPICASFHSFLYVFYSFVYLLPSLYVFHPICASFHSFLYVFHSICVSFTLFVRLSPYLHLFTLFVRLSPFLCMFYPLCTSFTLFVHLSSLITSVNGQY